MIKSIRILTLVIAFLVLMLGAFNLNPRRELLLASKAYENGDFDQAMRHARRAIIFSTKEYSKEKGNSLLLEYKIAMEKGKFLYALNCVMKAEDKFRKCCSCYLKEGFANYALRNFSVSVNNISKAFKCEKFSNKTASFYYAIRGLDYVEMGDFMKAQNDAEKSLSLDGDNPVAHLLKSKIFLLFFNDKENAFSEARKSLYLGFAKRGFFDSEIGKRWHKYIINPY